MIDKPRLKPIGSVAGIGGKQTIHQYLNQQFSSVGFSAFDNGVPALAKYKGVIDNREIKCTFTMLKQSKYQGIDNNHQFRYRTFQGIRMRTEISVKQKTRLIIAKQTKGKWLKRITKWVMHYKKFKRISMDYLNKEVYSPDELFAHSLINDAEVQNTLQNLTDEKTQTLSWGMVLIPEQLTFGTTFANLDDFETELLNKRFDNLTNLAKSIENKPIVKELKMTKTEIMARDNPKKLMWRGLWKLLIILVIGMLIFGLMFTIRVKFGLGYDIALIAATYLIYKYI